MWRSASERFAFWLFLFGSHDRRRRLPHPAGRRRRSAGSPISRSPAPASRRAAAATCWMLGLGMSGFGTILGAVNFITTIITMRAPGMTMWRMPIFSWNTLITSILVLMAFPVLAAAILAAAADRVFGAHIYDPANGGVAAVAAPVLVLRSPRGVHHRAAVLRHRLRDLPGVQPQADLRLQDASSTRRSRSRRSRSRCGRTTCTSPARCCCRSSP